MELEDSKYKRREFRGSKIVFVFFVFTNSRTTMVRKQRKTVFGRVFRTQFTSNGRSVKLSLNLNRISIGHNKEILDQKSSWKLHLKFRI